MALKPSRDLDELCYPFLYEASAKCDYEIATDELCKRIGEVVALLPEGELWRDLREELGRIQPLAFHLNGSVRGRLGVLPEELAWLHERHSARKAEVAGRVGGFVLPQGPVPVPQLNLAASCCKRAIRLLVLLDREADAAREAGRAGPTDGRDPKPIPEILDRVLNLLCNHLFVLGLVVNQRLGVDEVPFASRSYGPQG